MPKSRNAMEKNPNWKGGKIVLTSKGRKHPEKYVAIKNPEHPRSHARGYVRETILIIEAIIGKYLPITAIIHHIDENSLNNQNTNLIVCESNAYHKLLHKRMRAFIACGYASWLKCRFCKQYDNPINLHLIRNGNGGYHSECQSKYDYKRRRKS